MTYLKENDSLLRNIGIVCCFLIVTYLTKGNREMQSVIKLQFSFIKLQFSRCFSKMHLWKSIFMQNHYKTCKKKKNLSKSVIYFNFIYFSLFCQSMLRRLTLNKVYYWNYIHPVGCFTLFIGCTVQPWRTKFRFLSKQNPKATSKVKTKIEFYKIMTIKYV